MSSPLVAEFEGSVAAHSRNDNALDNTDLERAPFDGLLTIYQTGSATGLRSTLKIGQRTAMDRTVVNTQNRMPVEPDDFIIGEVEVFAGETVRLIVENTTAGALTYRTRARFDPGVVQ